MEVASLGGGHRRPKKKNSNPPRPPRRRPTPIQRQTPPPARGTRHAAPNGGGPRGRGVVGGAAEERRGARRRTGEAAPWAASGRTKPIRLGYWKPCGRGPSRSGAAALFAGTTALAVFRTKATERAFRLRI